jgi:hypothetical protein
LFIGFFGLFYLLFFLDILFYPLYYHLNFSPKNKNEKVFAKYGNPGEKFGYPVFIILDKNGKQIHTQSSEVFEEGKGYSLEKVENFFKEWIAKN